MTLYEYLSARNGFKVNNKGQRVISKASLSLGEKRVFGISNQQTDIPLTEEQIKEAILHVFRSDWVASRTKTRLMRLVSPHVSKDSQYLYLFQTPNFHYKIGVSKHPATRARNIATESGQDIRVVGVWEVCDARYEEQHLHKVFKKDRTIGEWFDRILTLEDIEQNMVGDYRRMTVLDIK